MRRWIWIAVLVVALVALVGYAMRATIAVKLMTAVAARARPSFDASRRFVLEAVIDDDATARRFAARHSTGKRT